MISTNSTTPPIDIIAQQAVEVLLQSGNHSPQLLIITTTEDMVAPLTFIPETSAEKGMLIQALAYEARKQSQSGVLTDVFMVTEAWMLKTDKRANELGNLCISEHPDRVEILTVTHLDVQQHKAGMRIYELKRDAQGELIEIVTVAGGDEPQEVRSYLLETFVAGWYAKPLL